MRLNQQKVKESGEWKEVEEEGEWRWGGRDG